MRYTSGPVSFRAVPYSTCTLRILPKYREFVILSLDQGASALSLRGQQAAVLRRWGRSATAFRRPHMIFVF